MYSKFINVGTFSDRRDKRKEVFATSCDSFAASDRCTTSGRPPPEPPPKRMTEQPALENISRPSVSVTWMDDNSVSSVDSLFDPPPLDHCDDSSSSGDDSISCYSALDEDDFRSAATSVASLQSVDSSVSDWSFTSLGPPPEGSLMDLWDKPFPKACLTDFGFSGLDSCYVKEHPPDTISTSDSSLGSEFEIRGLDDDSYASCNPAHERCFLSLHKTRATLCRVVLKPTSAHTGVKVRRGSQLVDSGGNFNMTNQVNLFVNVVPIKPFSIDMAAQESKSSS